MTHRPPSTRPSTCRLGRAVPLAHATAAAALALALAGCGAPGGAQPAASPATPAVTAAPGVTATGAEPGAAARADADANGREVGEELAVENCGVSVTLAGPPQRILALDSAPLPALDALGGLDRVVATAGDVPLDSYSPRLAAQVGAIPALTDRVDATGHVQISLEAILGARPDLVLGTAESAPRAALADAGIPQLVEPAYCDGLDGPAEWDDARDQVRTYARVLGADAGPVLDRLDARLAALEERAAASPQADARVAVLYPSPGGAPPYAYGAGSMSNAVVLSAGLQNVYAERSERVFEVGAEDLLARDPDWIVALHAGTDEAEVLGSLAAMPGGDGLRALREGRVVPMALNLAEPPGPLALDGLERLLGSLEETS